MTYILADPFSYLTTWSLLISYSIFIWTIFLGAPKWLFLFAACSLTTTSIIGTFFLTMPSVEIEASKEGSTPQKIMLEDTLIHSGPLILFLVLFNFLSKRVYEDVPKLLIDRQLGRLGNFKFTFEGYHKIIIICAVVILAYLGYIKFSQVYFYDYFTLVILAASVFVTSFQIYSSLINTKKF